MLPFENVGRVTLVGRLSTVFSSDSSPESGQWNSDS